MIQLKALCVGAAMGVLSTLAGIGLAKADCSQDDEFQRAVDAASECETNYGEVVRSSEGFVAWCVPDATAEACLDISSQLDCSPMTAEACDAAMGEMFWACVQLAYSAEAR